MMPDVMILCGGKGERLRTVISDRPKPLAEVQGRPFLDILIDGLSSFDFRRFILLAGYQGDQIKEYAIQKKQNSSLHFECIIEQFPLGTAGALRNAVHLINTRSVVVLNGDSFCPVDYSKLFGFHKQRSADMTIVTSFCKEGEDFGSITKATDGRIVAFAEKKQKSLTPLINAGIYLIERSLIETVQINKKVSLEEEAIPFWISANRHIYAYPASYQHLDIGTPERFATAQKYFNKKGSNACAE